MRPHAVFIVTLIASLLLVSPASGQTRELTSSDRLALLYAPQLNFSRQGDPMIRVGIAEGRSSVEFTPSLPLRVLPTGEGGPEIELPANATYTVRARNSKKGDYRHLVIVSRLPVVERTKANKIQNTWAERGFTPEVLEVGGLFAVQGKVFDSRTVLIGVGATRDRKKAAQTRRDLETRFGVDSSIHSEVVSYPTVDLTLSGKGVDAEVRVRDVLWVSGPRGKETDIRYTIPGIEKSYGQGKETRTYTGSLIFAPDRNGKIVAMVSLGAERLLKGVVPAETYTSAPEDALRAQAVAARNELFSSIGVRNLAEPYMLRADVMDQVYGGTAIEHPRTSAAVDATRGQVMFYGKKIIEAVYSSNAGGFTESNENVWDMEPRPWLRGKPDAPAKAIPIKFAREVSNADLDAFLDSDFDANSKTAPISSSKFFRWTRTVDVSKPHAWLKENNRSVGRIKDVRVLSRGISGRIIRFEITGDAGKTVVERELNVRRLFGGLRSGLFTMKVHKDSRGYATRFDFKGAGFGHGVGMCQTGAIGLASRGTNYRDILKHYYTGIKLEKLYD